MPDAVRSGILGVLLLALLGAFPAAAGARVVTLAPHLADLVCAVDACPQLVGVTRYTDTPGAEHAPIIGDAHAINLEAVLALRPDLVLAWEGGTSPQLVQRLRALGLRVEWLQVQRLDEIGTALERVGALVERHAQGRAAAQAYRAGLADLRRRHAARRPLRVFYQIELQPMFTISGRSPISEAIAVCGGVNVFADLRPIAAQVSVEAVLAARPDVIVFGSDDAPEAIRRHWQRWPQLAPVAGGQLYAIASDRLARQSPRILEGIASLCAALEQARRAPLSPAAR